MRVQRRRALERDRWFLEDAHVRALGPVALVGYGWTATRLLAQFRREIDLAACDVIVVDDRDAGYVSVQDRGSVWYIDAIAILPRYQKKGVGSAALRDVLDRAGRRIVRLNVLHVNPARALYERLGFVVVARDAQRQIMEWRAS